ncbi:MAG: SMC-Scp complex subunit ScpB [Clostridia bacterium]|nr:SMC-Scp complex subunit ScpB [Clostridia bacterium]MBR3552342.1 SMC-Scp complex subunit ScpB [Clostridia bacterium]
MNLKELQSTLEAVLFAVGDPVEPERLAEALEVDALLIKQMLENLTAKYDEEDSGLQLLKLGDRYQLCSRAQYGDAVRKVLEIRRNTPLSQAAMEVLAIVAYHEPVTKAFIEQIRGVDCSAVLSSLCQKALIEERGRLELPGRPLIYGTTPNFLRCFSLSSLEELPKPPEKPLQNEAAPTDDEKKFKEISSESQQKVDEI